LSARNEISKDFELEILESRNSGLKWKELKDKYSISSDLIAKILKNNGYKYRRDLTFSDIFKENLPVNKNINSCWLWKGGVRSDGYGRIKIKGKERGAHVVSYEFYVGKIPDGMVIDHVCHNSDLKCAGGPECLHRKCVNPYHLEPATKAVNTLRGRGTGAKNSRKTHCLKGHPLSGRNLLPIYKDGARRCRQCKKEREKLRSRRLL
jgi:hypothetical protein